MSMYVNLEQTLPDRTCLNAQIDISQQLAAYLFSSSSIIFAYSFLLKKN